MSSANNAQPFSEIQENNRQKESGMPILCGCFFPSALCLPDNKEDSTGWILKLNLLFMQNFVALQFSLCNCGLLVQI